MKINEEYEYDANRVKSLIEKYKDLFKRDRYDEIFDNLTDGDASDDNGDASDDKYDLLRFLYSIGIDVFDYLTKIIERCFSFMQFPDENRDIVLPSTIKSIGEYAFAASNIQSLDMSQMELQTIPNLCCSACNHLSDVKFPKNLESIGRGSFNYTSLLSVNIPEGVKTIDYGAFSMCEYLKTASFPSTLMSLDEYAFSYCKKLSVLMFGSNDVSIHPTAFDNCKDLKQVYVSGTDESGAVVKFFQEFFNSVFGMSMTKTNYSKQRVEVSR